MRQPYADGTLGLPFFSKVSLQVSVERLRKLGFDVAIELIEKPASSAGVRRGRTSSVATSEEAGGKALAKS